VYYVQSIETQRVSEDLEKMPARPSGKNRLEKVWSFGEWWELDCFEDLSE